MKPEVEDTVSKAPHHYSKVILNNIKNTQISSIRPLDLDMSYHIKELIESAQNELKIMEEKNEDLHNSIESSNVQLIELSETYKQCLHITQHLVTGDGKINNTAAENIHFKGQQLVPNHDEETIHPAAYNSNITTKKIHGKENKKFLSAIASLEEQIQSLKTEKQLLETKMHEKIEYILYLQKEQKAELKLPASTISVDPHSKVKAVHYDTGVHSRDDEHFEGVTLQASNAHQESMSTSPGLSAFRRKFDDLKSIFESCDRSSPHMSIRTDYNTGMDAEKKFRKMGDSIIRLTDSNTKLTDENVALKKERTLHILEMKSMKRDIERTRFELSSMDAKMEDYKKLVKIYTSKKLPEATKLNEIQIQCEELMDQKCILSNKLKDIELSSHNKVSEKEDQIASLNMDFNRIKIAHNELLLQLQIEGKKQVDIEKLNALIITLKADNNFILQENTFLRKSSHELSDKVKEVLELKETIRALTNEKSILEERNSQLEIVSSKQNVEAAVELSAKADHLERVSKELECLKLKYEILRSRKLNEEEMLQQLKEAQSICTDIASKNNLLASEILEKENNNEKQKLEIMILTEENIDLKKQLSDVKEKSSADSEITKESNKKFTEEVSRLEIMANELRKEKLTLLETLSEKTLEAVFMEETMIKSLESLESTKIQLQDITKNFEESQKIIDAKAEEIASLKENATSDRLALENTAKAISELTDKFNLSELNMSNLSREFVVVQNTNSFFLDHNDTIPETSVLHSTPSKLNDTLRLEIQNLLRRLQKGVSQYEILLAEHTLLTAKHDALTDTMSSLEASTTEKLEQIIYVENEREKAMRKIDELESRVISKEASLSLMYNEKKALDQEYQQIQGCKEELLVSIQVIQGERDQMRINIDLLEEQNKILDTKYHETLKLYTIAQQTLDELLKEKARADVELSISLQDTEINNIELNDKLKNLSMTSLLASKQKEQLEEEVEMYKKNYISISDELKSTLSLNAKSQESIKILLSEKEELGRLLLKLESDINSSLIGSKNQIMVINCEKKESLSCCEAESKEKNDFTKRLDAIQLGFKSLTNMNAEYQSTIKSHEETFLSLSTQNSSLNTKLLNLITNSNSSIAALTAQLDEAISEKEKLNYEVKNLHKKSNQSELDHDAKVHQLSQINDSLNLVIAELQIEIKNSEHARETQILEANSRKENLSHIMNDLQITFNYTQNQFSEKIQQITLENECMIGSIAEMQMNSNYMERKIHQLEQQLQTEKNNSEKLALEIQNAFNSSKSVSQHTIEGSSVEKDQLAQSNNESQDTHEFKNDASVKEDIMTEEICSLNSSSQIINNDNLISEEQVNQAINEGGEFDDDDILVSEDIMTDEVTSLNSSSQIIDKDFLSDEEYVNQVINENQDLCGFENNSFGMNDLSIEKEQCSMVKLQDSKAEEEKLLATTLLQTTLESLLQLQAENQILSIENMRISQALNESQQLYKLSQENLSKLSMQSKDLIDADRLGELHVDDIGNGKEEIQYETDSIVGESMSNQQYLSTISSLMSTVSLLESQLYSTMPNEQLKSIDHFEALSERLNEVEISNSILVSLLDCAQEMLEKVEKYFETDVNLIMAGSSFGNDHIDILINSFTGKISTYISQKTAKIQNNKDDSFNDIDIIMDNIGSQCDSAIDCFKIEINSARNMQESKGSIQKGEMNVKSGMEISREDYSENTPKTAMNESPLFAASTIDDKMCPPLSTQTNLQLLDTNSSISNISTIPTSLPQLGLSPTMQINPTDVLIPKPQGNLIFLQANYAFLIVTFYTFVIPVVVSYAIEGRLPNSGAYFIFIIVICIIGLILGRPR